MFRTILLTVFTVMHIYVFLRIAYLPIVEMVLPRKIVFILGLIVWICFWLGRFYGHDGDGFLATRLEFFGMVCFGGVFLTTLPFLTVDIATGFGFLVPAAKNTLRTLAFAAGMILTIVALVQGMRAPVVRNYSVHLAELPDEMDNTTVVALSDMHIGSILGSDWLDKRITQVLAQKPDLILILGDFFEGHGHPQTDLIPVLNRMSAPLGVWAVPGNHEFHGRDNICLKLFEKSGFHVMRNQWIEIRPGFILAGVDDLTSAYRSGKNTEYITKALKNRAKGATLLLSHTPWEVGRFADAGVDLMLSGHTHGGQIWPFDYLVQRTYPYLAGLYEYENMSLIVSRGAGTWGPRMRLWQPGEILRITLRKGLKGK
ncbi:MAG: metallophosphoesterase [Proteobacteria bacterium]|nr:metallophosphoesterase [Pseudomonadota bacterium]